MSASSSLSEKALKEKADMEIDTAISNKKSLQAIICTELQKTKLTPRKPKPSKDNQKSKKQDSDTKVTEFHSYCKSKLTSPLEGKGQRSCLKTANYLRLCQEERQRQGYLASLQGLAESWQLDIAASKIRYKHPLSWLD